MATKKKPQNLACPTKEFAWIEDMNDLEKLGEIYAKLESISGVFGGYGQAGPEKPVAANEIYGFWFIMKDICKELAGILKVDYWTGEIGNKKQK